VVVAVKYAATVSPTTENLAYGEVVPMPTLPVESIVNRWLPPVSKSSVSAALRLTPVSVSPTKV